MRRDETRFSSICNLARATLALFEQTPDNFAQRILIVFVAARRAFEQSCACYHRHSRTFNRLLFIFFEHCFVY